MLPVGHENALPLISWCRPSQLVGRVISAAAAIFEYLATVCRATLHWVSHLWTRLVMRQNGPAELPAPAMPIPNGPPEQPQVIVVAEPPRPQQPPAPPQPEPVDSSMAVVPFRPRYEEQRGHLGGEAPPYLPVLLQESDFPQIRLANNLQFNLDPREQHLNARHQHLPLIHLQQRGISLPPSVTAIRTMLQMDEVPKLDFHLALERLYGQNLISRTERSGLIDQFPQTLTKQHMLEWLAVICQGVTLDDLTLYLNQLRDNTPQAEILHLIENSKLAVWATQVEKAEQLPEAVFREYFTLFRNPLRFLIGPEEPSLWEQLRGFESLTNSRCARYVFHDYDIHKLMKINRTNPEFPLVPHEMLSRVVAYAKPESIELGAVIPVFNEDNPGIAYYQLTSRVNQKGVHAYLFTPIHHPDLPAKLIFRGTGGRESIERDLEPSVGQETFDKFSEKLLDMIRIAEPSKIDICGHSLGAADAQRMTALIVDKGLPVERIRMFAYCSPKIDMSTVHQWNKNIDQLSKTEKPPNIELWYAQHLNDVVSWMGESNLPGSHYNFLHSNYLLVESNSGSFQTSQHHRVPFFASGVFDFATDGRRFTFHAEEQYKEAVNQMGAIDEGDGYDIVAPNPKSFQEAQRIVDNWRRHRQLLEASQLGAAQRSLSAWGVSVAVAPFKQAGCMALQRLPR